MVTLLGFERKAMPGNEFAGPERGLEAAGVVCRSLSRSEQRRSSRRPLVGVGTREAYLAVRSDDQLENRFQPFPLPRWEPDLQACSLLASFAAALPLHHPSRIATEEMAR